MKERWGIKNHINTVNAGAMCTIAELTAGLALDVTLPKELRFIPKKMSVAYLKKGKGVLEATCNFDPSMIKEGDIILPVILRDSSDQKVFTADITMYVSRRKKGCIV